MYWIAELFCSCLTPNVLGKLLVCCLPRRPWVMHCVFFSCLLVFPIAIAWVWVPGWGTPLWAVILCALLPAPSYAGQVLSCPAGLLPLALIQHHRADRAELSHLCCKATPTSGLAQAEPFSAGNWRYFHVIENVQCCITAETKMRWMFLLCRGKANSLETLWVFVCILWDSKMYYKVSERFLKLGFTWRIHIFCAHAGVLIRWGENEWSNREGFVILEKKLEKLFWFISSFHRFQLDCHSISLGPILWYWLLLSGSNCRKPE